MVCFFHDPRKNSISGGYVMKGISKLGLIVSKFLEILHFIAAALMVVLGISSVVATDALQKILSAGAVENGPYFATYGFEVNVTNAMGNVDMTLFLIFCVGAAVILTLFALVFRNVNLILKGSEKETPFQKKNIHRLKQIGLMVLAVPVLGVVFQWLCFCVVGVDHVEISVDLGSLVLGILILCLTQFFAHGAELEEDVDGLL